MTELFNEIRAARAATRRHLHTTPLLSSGGLSRSVGSTVLLKAELFQKTGSFKPRGALTKLLKLSDRERARGVVTVSSGNHAQAVAYAARELGVRCVSVMWPSVSQQKLSATRTYGATVDLEAGDALEAIDRANTIAADEGLALIHAYDDRDVIAGQGTVGLEILEQAEQPEAILVPVSGGGLLAGVAAAVKAVHEDARIIAVEPAASPSLARALAAGEPVYVAQESLADGLGAPRIGSLCYDIAAPLVDDIVAVTDAEIINAMRWLFVHMKIAAEPAGAITTAALLAGRVASQRGRPVVAIVSGGNIDLASALQYIATNDANGANRDGRPATASPDR